MKSKAVILNYINSVFQFSPFNSSLCSAFSFLVAQMIVAFIICRKRKVREIEEQNGPNGGEKALTNPSFFFRFAHKMQHIKVQNSFSFYFPYLVIFPL